MPPVNRPLDEGSAHRRAARRLENQERPVRKPARTKIEEWASFNWDNPVVPASYADLTPWPVRLGGQVAGVDCTAGTAASGTSTFELRINGAVVGSTITFPASTTGPIMIYAGNVRVPPGTRLHLVPLTIGTGLKGFIGNVVMKP